MSKTVKSSSVGCAPDPVFGQRDLCPLTPPRAPSMHGPRKGVASTPIDIPSHLQNPGFATVCERDADVTGVDICN